MVLWKQVLAGVLGVAWSVSIGTGADTLQRIGRDPANGLATAVVVKGHELLHTSQLLPRDSTGKISNDDGSQIDALLANLQRLLEASSLKKSQIVKINFYVADASVTARVKKRLARWWCSCLAGSQLRRITVT